MKIDYSIINTNKLNEEKLKKALIRAKKWVATNYYKKEKDLIQGAIRVNSEVCLVVADFKCQKCGTEENLTFHHLVMRRVKEFCDFWRYASQRYYWANILILCKKCHAEYHGIFGKDIGEMGIISKEKIEKIKKKFYKK